LLLQSNFGTSGKHALANFVSGLVVVMTSWLLQMMASSVILDRFVTIKEKIPPASAAALKVGALQAIS
jgi:hypothetical protein